MSYYCLEISEFIGIIGEEDGKEEGKKGEMGILIVVL